MSENCARLVSSPTSCGEVCVSRQHMLVCFSKTSLWNLLQEVAHSAGSSTHTRSSCLLAQGQACLHDFIADLRAALALEAASSASLMRACACFCSRCAACWASCRSALTHSISLSSSRTRSCKNLRLTMLLGCHTHADNRCWMLNSEK